MAAIAATIMNKCHKRNRQRFPRLISSLPEGSPSVVVGLNTVVHHATAELALVQSLVMCPVVSIWFITRFSRSVATKFRPLDYRDTLNLVLLAAGNEFRSASSGSLALEIDFVSRKAGASI
jgi:hypothetical protein